MDVPNPAIRLRIMLVVLPVGRNRIMNQILDSGYKVVI